MVKIATWNVNSIKTRLPHALRWLEDFNPDILMMQELKCVSENFPKAEIEALGYYVHAHGQKAYNGVALLSREPLEDVQEGLPGNPDDEQARYLEATTFGLRVASIYLPNGNPVDTEKFPYKLEFMQRLHKRAQLLLENEQPIVLAGDYNIIPEPEDCYSPKAWEGDALFRPESREAFRSLLNLGYTESFRALNKQHGQYSFWDYQRGAWQKDNGIRIDHLLLSPQAADRLASVGIDKTPRGWEKASDHTPVWIELK